MRSIKNRSDDPVKGNRIGVLVFPQKGFLGDKVFLGKCRVEIKLSSWMMHFSPGKEPADCDFGNSSHCHVIPPAVM